jgi:aminomethyltransferase
VTALARLNPVVASMSFMTGAAVTLNGVSCFATRSGYTGEDGFEISVPASDAEALARALLAQPEVRPAGLGARDTLRLEGRLSLYGNEIDETTNPLEAGLAWVVKLDKPRDFVGKAALEAIRAAGLARKMVGFEVVGRGIARHGYPIVAWPPEGFEGSEAPGPAVGVVTSGSPAPTLDKNIGLGYVPAALAAVGTRIGIEIRGKAVEAVVVKTPFYKRTAS